MVGKTLGHYLVAEQIGSGGMGVVYRAHDQRLDRDVALKVLPHESISDITSQQRLRREALALSKLNHPNIAHIYDFDVENGIAFLVMECIQGTTLARLLANGALPEETAIRIGAQIASALESAAEVGVVHRDIKPSNIMLTPKGDVKVLDFGLAMIFRASENELTQSRPDIPQTAGTLAYMAPEQLKGEPADFRSDIYSLGSVLYEVATGRRVFKAITAVALIAEILNKTPEPPRTINSHLSIGFDNTVMRCLAKEPARRFERASDVRIALQSIIDGRGVIPNILPVRRLSPRIKLLIGALSALMVAGGIAIWNVPRKTVAVKAAEPSELAVLPLNATTNDSDDSAFNNGLIETLTNRLTQLSKDRPLQVVPASEVRAKGVTNLQEARQQFGATLGLEISIERSGQMVRVNYALVDAKNHKQLRGDTITAATSDPFALEDRVGDSVVKSLEIELQPQELSILADRGTKQPAAYDYYLQGRGYLQDFQKRENLDSAITEFDRALQEDPRFALAYAGLGQAQWRLYELDKTINWAHTAQASCERSIFLDPSQAESHLCLGMIFVGTGKYGEGVIQYQRAVDLEPTNDDAIRGLASAYSSLGRNMDAEKTYQTAIATRPQYWRGYNSLGSLYVSEGRYAEAVKMFLQVIALAPDSFQGYSNLGGTYIQLGQYNDAVAALQHSIDIRPTADALSNLGTALYDLRRFDEAAKNYKESLKLNDQDYVLWGNLADAYYYSGKNQSEARDAYKQAISLAKLRLNVNPKDFSVLADIAGYYSALNLREEAFSYLNQALRESGPGNPNLLFEAALVHNQFGETKAALDLLEKSLAAGYSATTIANAPALDNLHSNPDFRALLADRRIAK